MRKLALSTLLLALAACTSRPTIPDPRTPAGVGDIGSSETSEALPPAVPEGSLETYKLSVVRDGVKKTRVAHNFWGGEWPGPVVDINAKDKKGTTTLKGYLSLREKGAQVPCTVKNGIYHPWSKSSPSLINYYSITAVSDYSVIKETRIENGPRIPEGSQIINVVYYGENYCGGTLKIGKTLRPISASCPTFEDPTAFKALSAKDDYREQWLHLSCQEKEANGTNRKVFIQDEDIMSQAGVTRGNILDYGHVGPAGSRP